MLNVLPSLKFPRRDNELPIMKKSSTLSAEPNRAMPYTETQEPRR
jgi:hypothetical protein